MPKTKKYKTEWDLAKHFYTSPRDPRILKDVERTKRLFLSFEKKHKNKTDYLKNEKSLRKALDDYEKLSDDRYFRFALYLHYLLDVESAHTEARALSTKISQEMALYSNKIIFFCLRLGRVPKNQQKKFLRSPILKKYRYFLEELFEHAKYNLSEPEEKIMGLLALPSASLWVDGVEKVLNAQTVLFGKKRIPISEALNTFSQLNTPKRRALWIKTTEAIDTAAGSFAESEVNALCIRKKISDDLRGFRAPYSATVLGNENSEREVLALVETVTKHFPIAHRFYKLKKKLLGLEELHYADRSARIGKIKGTFSFNESLKILRKQFSLFNPIYTDILDRFVANGQIDVFPHQHKTSGAYCSATSNNPTFVLLNHTNTFNSVMTFAHEMGHAIHFELSKKQPLVYQDVSTAVAETASTLFENVVFDELFSHLNHREKIIALHDKLNDAVSTIFRQIACFNFELELHKQIRERGQLSKKEIGAILNKHMQSYLGPTVKMHEYDGNFFISWSHIRHFFYVYTYAYGELVSDALYQNYKSDTKYEEKIRAFLSAGSSKRPDMIFKDIGIDVTKPSFFETGLKKIEGDITKLERLTK